MMKLDEAWMRRECVGPIGEREWIAVWAMAAPGVLAAQTAQEAIDAFGAALLRYDDLRLAISARGGVTFGDGVREVRVILHDNDHDRMYMGPGPTRLKRSRQA